MVCIFICVHILKFLCFQGFVSPADRTYDALGLVNRLSKHSAAAAVEACEMLASGNTTSDKENKDNTDGKELVTRKSQIKIMVRSINYSYYSILI